MNMNPTLRVVTQLPLACLWNESGDLSAFRGRELSADDVRGLLRQGQVQFVVANCSEPLRWIPVRECYDFWKGEVQPHLAGLASRVSLHDFPGEYCYFASEWQSTEFERLVVLEMNH